MLQFCFALILIEFIHKILRIPIWNSKSYYNLIQFSKDDCTIVYIEVYSYKIRKYLKNDIKYKMHIFYPRAGFLLYKLLVFLLSIF